LEERSLSELNLSAKFGGSRGTNKTEQNKQNRLVELYGPGTKAGSCEMEFLKTGFVLSEYWEGACTGRYNDPDGLGYMPDSQGPSMAFYGKWGGLAQSIKSLSEMVKENPYFQYGGGGEVTKI